MGEKETVNREKLFSRDFAFICAVNFLAFFSIYLIIPILPTFLEEKGYSNFLIGALMSMLLIPTLLRPFLGRMSDTRGRKPLLVWGTLLLSTASFFYAGFDSAAPLFAVRFINGIGLAAFHTAAFALISDLSPPSRRLQGIAIFFISIDVTIAIAPVVARLMQEAWGYKPVYLLAGGLAMSAFLLSLALREREGDRPAAAAAGTWRGSFTPLHRLVLLTTMGFTFTYGSLSTFIVLSAEEVGISQGELFFTVFAATLLVIRLGVGAKADGWSRRALVLGSGAITLVGLVGIAYSGSLAWLIAGSFVYALGFAYLPTTLSAMLLDHTPDSSRGMMLGMYLAAFDIGMALGGLLMGPLADRWGYTTMYLAGGGLALACLVWFFLRTSGMAAAEKAGYLEEQQEMGPLTEF